MGKKVNGIGCLHCAWISAIQKKYPKYAGSTTGKKNRKIADEVVQSAVMIAARGMASLSEEGKAKFLADVSEEVNRLEGRSNRMRPLIEALIKKMTGVEGKVMSLAEVKAMIESLGQAKN